MSAYTVPISELKATSEQGASWISARSFPGWIRKPLALWVIPHAFKFVNHHATNEWLASISAHQAADLYAAFSKLHGAGLVLIDRTNSSSPLLKQILELCCIRALTVEMDHLEDTIEALAWGCDPHLRSMVDSAVGELQAVHPSRSFCLNEEPI